MGGELAFFELGVGDTERGRAFYEGLFGWKFEPGPSGKGFAIGAPNVRGGMHGDDAGASSAGRSRRWTSRAMRRRSRGSDASSSAATTRAPPSGCINRRARRDSGRGLDQLAIPVVVEHVGSMLQRDPAQLVDLVVGMEAAV